MMLSICCLIYPLYRHTHAQDRTRTGPHARRTARAQVRTRTHTRAHPLARTFTRTGTHACTYKRTRTGTRACARTLVCVCTFNGNRDSCKEIRHGCGRHDNTVHRKPLKCRNCHNTQHLVRRCPPRFCQSCGERGYDWWDKSCTKFLSIRWRPFNG